ncbi:Serine/threonine protein kinase [Geodermatophilus amargosae]|uniref:non-specific serine/threonine protein kinase n=1 Tax=Geodermatophilus amargosae TaxID=1296565 RepID=A0A1I6X8N3_9ACTN|nr:serine/threonine-protein kinase [Geodermatophilus amargosae]SFT34629.1 Serine/threonine protein kinase [Geodermatophilus amargosae]
MTSTVPGRLVAGRYRLLERIGGGGMGAVWLGRDELLDRQVAVKQVLLAAGADPETTDQQRLRALREGRIAARLSHPHAISVYDVALEQGVPWLVMEYLPSRSLAEVLAEDGPLRTDQAAQVGAQLADALAAVHAAGIVHRDVKPANVLIGRGDRIDGLVKITDFGISHASGDVTLTQTGQITGTPAFLAPEVAQGSEMTPASDVFSLGATLYTCVEGQPPFGMDDNALRLLHRVAGGEIRPPRHAGSLERPLLRMLARDPADRPGMPEVRDVLVKLAAGRDGDPTTVLLARTDLQTPRGRNRTARFAAEPQRTGPPTAVQPVVAPADAPPDPPGPPVRQDPPTLSEPPAPTPGPEPGPGPASGPPSVPPDERPVPLVGPRKRRRGPLLVAALVLLVVLAALGTWLALRGGDGGSPSAGPTSPGPAGATTSESADSTTEPAPAPEEPTEDTAEEAPATDAEESASDPAADPADEVRQTLEEYYEYLPGDPESAYAMTGPSLRSRASLGYYSDFFGRWDEVSLIDVQDVTDEGDSLTATSRVEFVRPGERLVETHAVTFVRGDDGELLVDLDVVA